MIFDWRRRFFRVLFCHLRSKIKFCIRKIIFIKHTPNVTLFNFVFPDKVTSIFQDTCRIQTGTFYNNIDEILVNCIVCNHIRHFTKI